MNKNKIFVEIDEATFSNLERVAKYNGFSSVEELLVAFASDFSIGCSVTLRRKSKAA